LAQQAGVPFVLRSTGWPDTERIRQAAAAKGVTLDLPEPSPVEAGDTGGGGSWLWIAAAGLGVLFLMRRRK
jgi:MYXO-CTERM domain-containing protein